MAVKSSSLQQYRTRLEADKLIQSGRTPLAVMLGNMHFWDGESHRLTEKLEAFAEQVREAQADGIDVDAKQLASMLNLLDKMLAARDKAQGCAKDAAPYVHPKLASIVPQPDEKDRVKLPPIVLEVTFEQPIQGPLTDLQGERAAPGAMEVGDMADSINERTDGVNRVIDGEFKDVG